nr:hypothetical protein BaRGS_005679 [Batillaria attramentaria]
MNWTGPDPVTFRIPTPAVPICEDGQFNITMWLSSPVEFAVQLHTVDTRLKLVVTNCTCWAGLGVDIGNPQMRLMTEKCPVETSLKILPFNRTMMGYRYNVFQFVNYSEVTIECDAIVCLNTEDTDVCDRSCTNDKPPPSYGRRRRRRRRQADTEHPVIRVFSGPVYIVNDDEPTDSSKLSN